MSPKAVKKKKTKKLVALDTETTGGDFWHGAKPYLVTICDEDHNQTWWEWDVDPITRQPNIPQQDLREIQQAIDDAGWLVLQNTKFDVHALDTIFTGKLRWDWDKVYDTLIAGHLLASNQPHDLTTMAMVYLRANLQPYEDDIEEATQAARRWAKSNRPNWRIAKKGDPMMPSAKEKTWKFDMWLPRVVAKEEGYAEDHPWYSLCSTYANSDSAATLALFPAMQRHIVKRKLWRIYEARLKVLRIAHLMEDTGISIHGKRLEELTKTYKKESNKANRLCVAIAEKRGFELELPKSGNNKSLSEFVFSPKGLNLAPKQEDLPKQGKGYRKSQFLTPTGKPSLSKPVLEHWMATLPEKSAALRFVTALRGKRKRDTALTYMEGYKRFWLPEAADWYRLHPSMNPTGTDTLRWSVSNPNEQNISKQEGFNLRYCFGPAPGREWWSLDAKNIELRLPAFEAGETEMIDLFRNEDKPPYYGSYHMLIFDTLHPDKFAKHGMDSKKVFESTWYQWTKNGNFAVQYGAVESSGTADRAYHVPGAQRRIQSRFTKVTELNKRLMKFAAEHGYVETIPDKTVDPDRGYPVECTRSRWGTILPTVPLNYHTQSSAMWWMQKAMVRCQSYLDQINENATHKAYLILQVHDELVFDFPRGQGPKPWKTNLAKVKTIRRLMEKGGDDYGIPTPVSLTYHAKTWSEGVSI